MEYSTITKSNPLIKENLFKKYTLLVIRALLIGLVGAGICLFASGCKLMIVASGSMEPTLPTGSLVIVTPCDYDDLQLGDIVTMSSGGYNFTHRIVGKFNEDPNLSSDQKMQDKYILNPGDAGYEESQFWVTRGDADNDGTHDGPLMRNIVGKVNEAHCWTWVGTCVRYVRQNYKLLLIMVILLGVFAYVLDIFKEKIIDSMDEDDYEEDEE